MKYYMLSDNLNQSERDRFGISIKDSFAISRRTIDGIIVRAVKTDSFRAPRKGEWYLSGSTPTAYKAPNDLSTAYRILRLVKLNQETKVILTEIP
jgi:hypothetical protein